MSNIRLVALLLDDETIALLRTGLVPGERTAYSRNNHRRSLHYFCVAILTGRVVRVHRPPYTLPYSSESTLLKNFHPFTPFATAPPKYIYTYISLDGPLWYKHAFSTWGQTCPVTPRRGVKIVAVYG